MSFTNLYSHWKIELVQPLKNWVDWVNTRTKKKCHKLKNVHFEKKCPKIKKHITFYNFSLKRQTIGAKKVVKPILETLIAANYVIVYVWLIHSLQKIFKNTQYKKE